MPLTNRVFVVAGSRDFPDKPLVNQVLDQTLRPGDVVISGMARGVDTWAAQTAELKGCRLEAMPADWSQGRDAGMRRNRAMLERLVTARNLGWEVNVLVFWDGRSPGTRNTLNEAKQRRLPLTVYQP